MTLTENKTSLEAIEAFLEAIWRATDATATDSGDVVLQKIVNHQTDARVARTQAKTSGDDFAKLRSEMNILLRTPVGVNIQDHAKALRRDLDIFLAQKASTEAPPTPVKLDKDRIAKVTGKKK